MKLKLLVILSFAIVILGLMCVTGCQNRYSGGNKVYYAQPCQKVMGASVTPAGVVSILTRPAIKGENFENISLTLHGYGMDGTGLIVIHESCKYQQ